jgi:hypothetical protein
VYDHVVYNTKTNKIVFTNETKTGGAEFSDAQLRALKGEPVTLVGDQLPKELRGQTISSKTTPYRITHMEFLTGQFTHIEL